MRGYLNRFKIMLVAILLTATLVPLASQTAEETAVTLVYRLDTEESPYRLIIPRNMLRDLQTIHIASLGMDTEPLISHSREESPSTTPKNPARQRLADWQFAVFPTIEAARHAQQRLERTGLVATAHIKGAPRPAIHIEPSESQGVADIPQLVGEQQYLELSPQGFGATFAWNFFGGAGERIRVADIEGDWNINHLDLHRARRDRTSGYRIKSNSWINHGTAEIGLLIGSDNNFGITGIANKAHLYMFSIFRKKPKGPVFDNVADAIADAAEVMRPGDVIFLPIEFSDSFTNGQGFPVEYYDDIFDAISFATSKGIIVVEAAGNGGMNLDSAKFNGAFNRKKRNSGAILVGAGGSPDSEDLKRLSFSNYGSRVDIQAWGRGVVTTGYGDLHRGRNENYTASFNGTSSASGLIAALCVSIQGYAKETLGRTLTPEEMLAVLLNNAEAQKVNPGQNIGPRPDLVEAFSAIDQMKSTR